MEKDTIRILYELYKMVTDMEASQKNEDYPIYDLTKITDKIKNHLDYYLGAE